MIEAKASGNLSRAEAKTISFDEIFDIDNEVIVDLMPATQDGVRGRDIYMKAFRKGRHVVTANKAPLALHWAQIMEEAASRGGKMIRYEATVAGGVPLFSFRDYCITPSEVISFRGGIVSLTVNLVMRMMARGGHSFQEAVKYAQSMGVAETDYRDDTSGLDAARKTVILANSLFGLSMSLNDLYYEGIDEGKRYRSSSRMVSTVSVEGGRVRAESRVEELSQEDPLLSLPEESLAYIIETENNGKLMVRSERDGPLETAAAVVNDIVIMAREIC